MTTLSRRDFLRVSGAVAAGTIAAACTPTATDPGIGDPAAAPTSAPAPAATAWTMPTVAPAAAPTQAPEAVAKYTEAPQLAELVAEGKLPPVDQRLPKNPSVYPVIETIGKYGGTIRKAFKGVKDSAVATHWVACSLTHFNPDLSLRPDLCEAWELDESASEFTIHFREGTRWSDGELFTSEDVRWWFEDVVKNKDLTSALPGAYSTGEPPVLMELEIVDDLTVVMRFAHSFPVFMHQQNSGGPFMPSHYMKQFHIEYTDDKAALEAKVKEAGFNSWAEYFDDRNDWYMNVDRPVLHPYIATNQLASELFIIERNPYFIGVDAEGQQLPYVDRVTFRLFESTDVFNMWILNGEIDLQGRHVDIGNYTLFKDGAEKGGYRVDLWRTDDGDTFGPNHASKNKRVSDFFNIRDVRIALNLAVDREEINELVYDGMCTPRQASPSSMGPHYYEPATKAFANYDPDESNRLLDEAGFTERDGDGFRKWTDGSGETLSFIMETYNPPGSTELDSAEMVIKYFADVGIKANLKVHERSLYYERFAANELEAAWQGGGHYTFIYLKPDDYHTGEKVSRTWAGAWGLWKLNHDDPNGEPPPEGHWLWDIWEISDKARVNPDEQERIEAHNRIMDIWVREAPVVGVLGEKPGPVIVKNGIRNFLGSYPFQTPTLNEHLLGTPVFFWDDPENHV